MTNNITTTLEAFIAEPTNYTLSKLETTFKSMVSKGHTESGTAHILHYPECPNMVIVQNSGRFLKTSPVEEILKEEDNAIEFKTQSGSIYRLSK
jgi:hypothetical protein